MSATSDNLIRTEFASYVRKAFYDDHNGETLGKQPYVDYLCHHLELFAKGETKQLVINLPPRHLKTFLGSICLTTWLLAHNPSARIMVITFSDDLAEQITYRIRKILRSDWYKRIFPTRIAQDRSRVDDFATTKGGEVFATSIGGQLAGRGGDYIIIDDPLDLKDAGNIKQLDLVNRRSDTILSRRNKPKTGQIAIIAHRLNEIDLSAYVRKQGGWRQIVLPLVAERKKTYDLGYGKWTRERGELLRPGSHSAKQLKHLRENAINPGFQLFYQQGEGGSASVSIKAEHFAAYDRQQMPLNLPILLSVDPGLRGGPTNSFSVIQAWCPFEGDHFLLDQWREQCGYDELLDRYRYFVRHLRPSVALIEATANGPALIAHAMRKRLVRVEEIKPDNRSKAARLLVHKSLIRRHHLHLPENAPWRADYIKEFVEFPYGPFDDQIDATTQYLDWIAVNPIPDLPPKRAYMVGVGSNGVRISASGNSDITSGPGIAVGRYRRFSGN